MPLRPFIGTLLAIVIALAARRAGSLTPGGALAAASVGAIAMAAGWEWGILLVAFFVASTALSRAGREAKLLRVGGIVEKEGARDALQVIANGGVFALAAVGAATTGAPVWPALGVGALASATADTWATEIGTLAGGEPRSILSGRPLAAGTSGGVTPTGTFASFAGAAFIALIAVALGWPARVAAAAAVGGVIGSVADSLLGALVQERRWCDRCRRATERSVHSCGASTTFAGGVRGFRNDAVNLTSGIVGGVAAALLAAW